MPAHFSRQRPTVSGVTTYLRHVSATLAPDSISRRSLSDLLLRIPFLFHFSSPGPGTRPTLKMDQISGEGQSLSMQPGLL
jgi:hypothetical protein